MIKKELPAVRHIFLIRHGATPGNLEHRYIGRTDESLSETGRREIERHCYPICDAVFCSPMRRCRETAELIHPARIPVEVADFRETDFGRFEGHTYQELQGDPAYRHWLRTEGTIPFPGGAHAASPRAEAPYTHKCTVCGRTDVTNPELEFRYCSKCKGYYCYCSDHINNHVHIQ